ncbi:MAG TPA: putative zinc-binding metallopeptidase [Pirellulaceae bacterium]|nr:putative zinc-binding metallopeptidase [Pirellulaceae bacterium]
MPRQPRRRAASRRRRKEPEWADYTDDELLQLRFCDLGLKMEGTVLEGRIERLHEELEQRGIEFRPHVWISDEWFSPDGIPGVAIPFYLAHPRLMRLERTQMLEVEGGSEDWCMKILRHETGHAIDTAYRLHYRKHYRTLFGKFTTEYPKTYQPRPYSKSFVLHLEPSYAQAHPAEDFAETFAVWLKPRSGWRTQYEGWPVLKKLEYVATLMEEIRGKKPKVHSREHVDPVGKLRKTLASHYEEKRKLYGTPHPNFYDQHLLKLFSNGPECARNPSAAAFLGRVRADLRKTVAHWTGEYQYTIDQVIAEMIDRCRELNLRLDRPFRQARRDALVLVTVQTMNYLHGGHHRVAL